MPFFYTPIEKARAIQTLVENFGNTRRVSQLTGIPERTLQRWVNEFAPSTVLIAEDSHEALMERQIRQRYVKVRNNLLDIVEILSDKILENPATAADFVLDYSRALKQLIHAEQLASSRSFSLIILWEDPQGFVRLSSSDLEF